MSSNSALSLGDIQTSIAPTMQSSEDAVKTMIQSLGDGSNASVSQLTTLQFDISVYTLTGQAISAIMKECSDTMKSVVQKI